MTKGTCWGCSKEDSSKSKRAVWPGGWIFPVELCDECGPAEGGDLDAKIVEGLTRNLNRIINGD